MDRWRSNIERKKQTNKKSFHNTEYAMVNSWAKMVIHLCCCCRCRFCCYLFRKTLNISRSSSLTYGMWLGAPKRVCQCVSVEHEKKRHHMYNIWVNTNTTAATTTTTTAKQFWAILLYRMHDLSSKSDPKQQQQQSKLGDI